MSATKLDEHALNRAACRNLTPILREIADFKGFGSMDITRLGGPDAPRKRLSEWRVGPYGDWRCSGDGSSGADLIALVAHLGSCDRATAAEFLQRLVARQEAA